MLTGDKTQTPGEEARRHDISADSQISPMSVEGSIGVEVHVVSPLRKQRKLVMVPSSRGDALFTTTANMPFADTGSLVFPTCTSAVRLSSFRGQWAYVVQAFQFSLTEPGMALVATAIFFTISLIGCITVFFIAPSLTTSLATRIHESLDRVVSQGEMDTLPASWMPGVVSMMQNGLRAVLAPSVLLGAAGMWVLGDPERRRPGKLLMGYGLLVFIHGLMLLYLLLSVFFSGQLGVWQNKSLQLFQDVLGKLDGNVGQCIWEYAYSCSGFSSCCVTNTSALSMSDEELLRDAEVWRSLCFVTMWNGTALTRRHMHGEGDIFVDITKAVRDGCGEITAQMDPNEDYPLYSTACALASGSAMITPSHSTSCEDFFIGHFSSTIGFDMCLLFGMTVCSLVTGVVVLITHYQRPRMSEFMPVNTPSASSNESAMMVKVEASGDYRGANRKLS
ncbi:hypothetical protein MNV84_06881 [Leishmania braziliensis]|nr:hypothetical protein MNV84_06881 [Leishmania braziliensis]CAJ2479565.1 unnamed protein product [Leishmania braziliensis]